jgi:hypothetical protein
MPIVDVQLFSCLQQLDQGVEQLEQNVHNIEAQLQRPLSSAEYYQLFIQLDKALQPLRQLRDSARALENCGSHILGRLDKLEQRSPQIYGNLITLAVDREVVEIRKEAEGIQKSLLNENLMSVAQKVDSLKRHISTLRHDNALSCKNLSLVSSIERFVTMVEKFLRVCEELSLERPKISDIRKARLDQPLQDLDPVTAELLMEIFEIAELYESGSPLASKRKERLPQNVLELLETHKKQFEEGLGLSSDKLYAPALLSTALELTQGKLDDPLEEVGAYYAELNLIEMQKN